MMPRVTEGESKSDEHSKPPGSAGHFRAVGCPVDVQLAHLKSAF